MAFTLGVDYDLFISYAHADNVEPNGEGWVTQFVASLELALLKRLAGSEALSLFFDTDNTRSNSRLPDLLTAVKSSALFLAIGSPNYATRDWTRQELDTFVTAHSGDLSRLFIIEYLPLDEGERYPPPIDDNIRRAGWRMSGRPPVAMAYYPEANPEEFQLLAVRLAEDIRSKLLALRYSAKSAPGSRPNVRSQESAILPRPSEGPADASRQQGAITKKTVLVAQVTDDVEDEADQLRRHLQQYESEVIILPHASYPQGGDAFVSAFAQDLKQSDLFVQLLGRRPGRVPPDLPAGYTRHQIEAAKASGVEVMQWRHPSLDTDSIGDPGYKATVTAETVVACGLQAFKQQVLDRVRKPKPKPRQVRSATVFINADRNDLGIAREIQRNCLSQLIAFEPANGQSSEANRHDLEERLTDCDVLLFIYGDTTQEWIRRQLTFYSKIRPRREHDPKLLAIYSGPPAEKPDIGITIPNSHVINCPENWNLSPLRTLIEDLRE